MMQNKSQSEKVFREFLNENLRGLVSFRPLLAFAFLSIAGILKIGGEHYLRLLSSPWFWLLFCFAILLDCFLSAIYWHFYVRSSRYKKQQDNLNSKP
jgi:hypothetical protein